MNPCFMKVVWVSFSHAPATTHPNCSLSSLLLLYGLQGQCKRRVLFAAFAVCIAALGVQRQKEGIWRSRTMKHPTLLTLLALSPLSWGYTFDDGTKFKGDIDSYIFLECTSDPKNRMYSGSPPSSAYRLFYSIFIEKSQAYSVNSDSKGWATVYPKIEDNKISFATNYRRDYTVFLNRTSLKIHRNTQQPYYFNCIKTDYRSVDAWLSKIRAERQI